MTDEVLRIAARESWWDNGEVSGGSVPVDIYTVGYMNGAKAVLKGRRQEVVWHDLRKNPQELPIGNVLDQDGNVVWYESIAGIWHYDDDDDTVCDDVIAWCHIPIFDEE